MGIAIDAQENVWVSDTGNNRIEKFSDTGEYLAQFGSFGDGKGQFYYPDCIAFDQSANIWVVDQNNHRVQELSSSGVYLTQFGSSGSDDGQFGQPVGIAVTPSGNIWVGDYGYHRIEEFAPVPEPSALVLLGIGAVSLLAYAWRRRARTA
jgi:DNA-binding beta-propeller fold protein YncE